MDNLRKFENEAAYSAATLSYPAVSWIVSGDTIHYDKTSGDTPTPPTPTNDEIMLASYGGSGEDHFTFFNCEASSSGDIVSITLDDEPISPITCQTDSYIDAEYEHIAKYTITGTTIGDWFGGDLGMCNASGPANLDILIPSQITEIYDLPGMMVVNLIVLAETPPYLEYSLSGFYGNLYVPDDYVDTYKEDGTWGEISSRIYPLSEYEGNLPVD